jgi:hypothetical protein
MEATHTATYSSRIAAAKARDPVDRRVGDKLRHPASGSANFTSEGSNSKATDALKAVPERFKRRHRRPRGQRWYDLKQAGPSVWLEFEVAFHANVDRVVATAFPRRSRL